MSRGLRIWLLWDFYFQLLCFQFFSPGWVSCLDWTCLATPQSCTAHLGVLFQLKGQHENLSSWESSCCAAVSCIAQWRFKGTQLSAEQMHHKFIREPFCSGRCDSKAFHFCVLMKNWKLTFAHRNFDFWRAAFPVIKTKTFFLNSINQSCFPVYKHPSLAYGIEKAEHVLLYFSVTALHQLSFSAWVRVMGKDPY